MLLFDVLSNFLILLFFQIILFNLFKIRKSWFLVTILLYFVISFLNYNNQINLENILNYFLINSTFITSYILFLTLVFNDSPTLIYLKKSKKFFLNKKFVSNRLKLMKKDNLISNIKSVTFKGRLAYSIIIVMSKILFKEK